VYTERGDLAVSSLLKNLYPFQLLTAQPEGLAPCRIRGGAAMTDQRRFRYIEQAARIADQLEPHVSTETSPKHHGERRGSGAAGSKAPIRIDVASALDDHDRDQLQELAIRKQILEPLDGQGPDLNLPGREARGSLLAQMLDDHLDPEPVAKRTASTMRRHFTVLTCVLADAEGHARLTCPRNHAPVEGLPTRTVVPAALLQMTTGLLVCMHPECDETLGIPRVLNIADETLFNDPDRLLTIEEVALLLGISEAAVKARIRRARRAGYELPVADSRVSAKGQKQNQYRLADMIKVNGIGRDLGTGIADWPKQPRQRPRPNPSA
jgi:biotin operon repressor